MHFEAPQGRKMIAQGERSEALGRVPNMPLFLSFAPVEANDEKIKRTRLLKVRNQFQNKKGRPEGLPLFV
jgi:hypothetical protein